MCPDRRTPARTRKPNPTQPQPLSAAAIMKLVDQGKLVLNDTVASYLPEWGNMEVGALRAIDGVDGVVGCCGIGST